MKLPKGRHVESRSVGDASKTFCRIKPKFCGAVRIKAKAENIVYYADLLADEKTIVAASLKTEGEEFASNRALSELGGRLLISTGKIDVFALNREEMIRSIKNNSSALLSVGVPPRELKVGFEGKTKRICEMMPLSSRITHGLFGGFGGRKSARGKNSYLQGALEPKIMEKYGIESELQKKKEDLGGGDKVKTGIDNFYDIIKEKRNMKITNALAKRFKVSRSQIIEWAEILEKHGMVEIHYPPIGQTEIRLIEGGKVNK